MKNNFFLLVSIGAFLFLVSLTSRPIFAQNSSLGVAITIDLGDIDFQEGDVICSGDQGYDLCRVSYDSSVFGVISSSPAASIENIQIANPAYLLSSGTGLVRVSSANGSITKGDSITTSETPGVGQLATESGYVIGMALEGYDSSDPAQVGQIQVALNIHAAEGRAATRSNLTQLLRRGLSAATFSSLDALRYLLATAVVLISFVLGFVYFGRAAGLGIEAIGRNPLASRKIQFAVLIHVIVTVTIVIAGLALAYLILIL